MPIRFRCPHCNQLMGIARRKAGTSVKCTTCHNAVTVPAEDGPASPPPEGRDVFDRSDFDAVLQRETTARGAVATPPAKAAPSGESQAVPAAASGLVLSAGLATLLTVVWILSLALSFVAGLLVDRFAL